ncbi:MAG: DegT/DnrJ/EryC1/StrS family aminotransferase [Armatimonadota bacterium]
MSIPMANLAAQYRAMESEINSALRGVLESGRFILGENVSSLEEEVAAMCGAKYGISVASGTDAITISLAALGIGPGDEVITTPFTFVATTEAIVMVGARPVYVDIDPVTFNIDPEQMKKAITSKTKALLPVHLYGQCAEMDDILEMADNYGLIVVCDAAQAIGSAYKGKQIGMMGDAATLSFFPTKNLGACGDGGMILMNDDDAAEKAKSLRFHGMSSSYSYKYVGFCSRLDALQAAILRVKLPKINEWNEARREHASVYSKVLQGSRIKAPVESPGSYHIYHQYTVRTPAREATQAILKEAGVDSAVYYPEPLHVQDAYTFLGYKEGDFPAAEQASKEVLSIPVHPELTSDQVSTVADALSAASEKV